MQNVLAWLLAGSLAYYMHVAPDGERAKEQEVGVKIA